MHSHSPLLTLMSALKTFCQMNVLILIISKLWYVPLKGTCDPQSLSGLGTDRLKLTIGPPCRHGVELGLGTYHIVNSCTMKIKPRGNQHLWQTDKCIPHTQRWREPYPICMYIVLQTEKMGGKVLVILYKLLYVCWQCITIFVKLKVFYWNQNVCRMIFFNQM